MKRNITLFVLAVLGIVAMTGCSKTGPTPGSTPNMKASIGAMPYIAPYCLAVQNGSQILIEGLGGTTTVPTYPYMALTILKWTGKPAIYVNDSTGTNFVGQYFSSTTSYELANIGSVIITSITADQINGAFSFTCYDGVVVSGGTFAARIKPQP